MTNTMANTQLDATPATSTTDPTLLPGRTLEDSSGFKVHVCSVDTSGATISVAMQDEALPGCTPPLSKPVIELPGTGQETGYRPFVSGKGMPGTTVEVQRIRNGTMVGRVGSAIVGADGRWATQIDQPLTAGPHNLAALSKNPGSATTGGFMSGVFNVIEAPVRPVILKGPGQHATLTPEFSGTGLPGSTVTIQITRNGFLAEVIATALVDGTGNWVAGSNQHLSEGTHWVAYYQKNGDHSSPGFPVFSFVVAKPQSVAP